MQKTSTVTVPFMLLGILFNICLVASNLLETKVIQVFGITATAGLIVFPISYIINDCIAEVWGFKKARLIILIFFPIAFAGLIPIGELFIMIGTQAVLKSLYEVIILPVTIRVVNYIKKVDGNDVYDVETSYNILNVRDL